MACRQAQARTLQVNRNNLGSPRRVDHQRVLTRSNTRNIQLSIHRSDKESKHQILDQELVMNEDAIVYMA